MVELERGHHRGRRVEHVVLERVVVQQVQERGLSVPQDAHDARLNGSQVRLGETVSSHLGGGEHHRTLSRVGSRVQGVFHRVGHAVRIDLRRGRVTGLVHLVYPRAVHRRELRNVHVLPIFLTVLGIVLVLIIMARLEREVTVGAQTVLLVVFDNDIVSGLQVRNRVGEQFLHAEVVFQLPVIVDGRVRVLIAGLVVVEVPLIWGGQQHVFPAVRGVRCG